MRPSKIFDILDLALRAREKGQIFNPLFIGEAGLGKSAIVQQWVAKQRERNPNFFFLDIRIAYMEAPDLIGFPEVLKDANGTPRTVHCIPEFWPTTEESPDLEGLILFEEPNRGTTGVMNCLMQVLTDRCIHKVKLPKGIILGGCINPDSTEYDVNHMDAALRNRFEEFEVEYDHQTFAEYIEKNDWHEDVQRYVNSGMWIYKTTSELGDNKDAKYISPRTWEKVNAALVAGVKEDRIIHRLAVTSILGRHQGNEFHKFSFDQSPVTADDIVKDKKAAIKRLKEQSDPNNYKGDMIAMTCESIQKHYGGLAKDCKEGQIDEDTLAEVASVIPSDQAINLIKGCGFKVTKGQVINFFKEFTQRHPELIKILKDNIKIQRTLKSDKK